MSLARECLSFFNQFDSSEDNVPIQEMSTRDVGKALLKHFSGLKEPSVNIGDLEKVFPTVDQKTMRQIITKFNQAGVLQPTNPGIYNINRSLLSRARVV